MAKPLPKTIAEFAEACKHRTFDEIYNLFENQISQRLRDDIYGVSEHLDSPEPFRAACEIIGKQYNIATLITF